ncbi:retrovirus-related pol polyprotein from transposon TNT 1-94 [Tanacetum coccineum]|uniref:Retrovirus-related pol polyprotein from transposon TNT 1-94 n=1 Tax=Tanacetum coccineum TaxID=301880 RepID=A0ABQ5GR60_9ASTR
MLAYGLPISPPMLVKRNLILEFMLKSEKTLLEMAVTQAEIISVKDKVGLFKQRKEDLFDEYETLCVLGNESIHDYFVRFHKLVNDMKITQLNIPTHQMNTKFVNNLPAYWGKYVTNVKQNMDISTTPYVQIYTHLKAYEPHAKKTLKKQEQSTSIVDPLAYIANLFKWFPKSSFHPPQTQLRTSSQSRGTHATVHDGHIVTEPVQRKAPGNVGNTGARGKKVICYNCRGEGHVARQCKEPKRKMDSQYFKDKALLMEAKEKGDVLDAEAESNSLADTWMKLAPMLLSLLWPTLSSNLVQTTIHSMRNKTCDSALNKGNAVNLLQEKRFANVPTVARMALSRKCPSLLRIPKLKAHVTGTTISGLQPLRTPKVLAPGMYNLRFLLYIPTPKRAKLGQTNPVSLPVKKCECEVVQIVLWYLDSGCSRHMTGDRARLINFVEKFIGKSKKASHPLKTENTNTEVLHTLHMDLCGGTNEIKKVSTEEDKKPNLQYFRVFGSLCYPTNDYDDVGKLKAKADIGLTSGSNSSGSQPQQNDFCAKQFRLELMLYSQDAKRSATSCSDSFRFVSITPVYDSCCPATPEICQNGFSFHNRFISEASSSKTSVNIDVTYQQQILPLRAKGGLKNIRLMNNIIGIKIDLSSTGNS